VSQGSAGEKTIEAENEAANCKWQPNNKHWLFERLIHDSTPFANLTHMKKANAVNIGLSH
jgi:hypothetical protein